MNLNFQEISLPYFNYFPDPIGAGVIEASDSSCICCHEQKGAVYCGPVFSEEDITDKLCPWCIQNGAAHKKFAAQFNLPEEVGDFSHSVNLSPVILDELCHRTPSFYGWEPSKWFVHCKDAALFMGIIGYEEYKKLKKGTKIRFSKWLKSNFELEPKRFCPQLSAQNSPSAYLFSCRHCSLQAIYADWEERGTGFE